MKPFSWHPACAGVWLALATGLAAAQSMSHGDVKASGAKPLTAEEAKALVTDAQARFRLNNGAERRWRNAADGRFSVTRDYGPMNRRSGSGSWSVREDGAYCLSFEWGPMDTETWCRHLYKVEDRYYAFALTAPDETVGGPYWFTR